MVIFQQITKMGHGWLVNYGWYIDYHWGFTSTKRTSWIIGYHGGLQPILGEEISCPYQLNAPVELSTTGKKKPGLINP